MTYIIDSLNWRYATKVFDKTKKISNEDLDEIIESFRLTSSSFWLQPWKLLVIKNQDIKNSLVPHSWKQSQISDCSDLLVLCCNTKVWEDYVEKFTQIVAKTIEIDIKNLEWYKKMMLWFISNSWEEWVKTWSNNQVYIALWNLLTVLAIKKIDSCAIWWFDSKKYDEVLNLSEKWFSSVVVLPIGYRSEEDKYSKLKKVRFNREEVVEVI